MDTFFLALADKYGNTVADNDISTLSIAIDRNTIDPDSPYPPFLGGNTVFDAVNGVFEISGVEFTGEPTLSYALTFDSDGIDLGKVSN